MNAFHVGSIAGAALSAILPTLILVYIARLPGRLKRRREAADKELPK